jgi:copper(I)-binding protein
MKLPSPIGALVISSRGKLEMSSAGPRLLLKGFKKRLNAYDSFELTLVFEKAGRMPIEVMAEEAETGEHKPAPSALIGCKEVSPSGTFRPFPTCT